MNLTDDEIEIAVRMFADLDDELALAFGGKGNIPSKITGILNSIFASYCSAVISDGHKDLS